MVFKKYINNNNNTLYNIIRIPTTYFKYKCKTLIFRLFLDEIYKTIFSSLNSVTNYWYLLYIDAILLNGIFYIIDCRAWTRYNTIPHRVPHTGYQ